MGNGPSRPSNSHRKPETVRQRNWITCRDLVLMRGYYSGAYSCRQRSLSEKFGGMAAINEPYMEVGFWQMMKKRGGWLCALFLSEMLTASAMQGYEGELEKAIVLTLFIPLIMSSGGNSGSQATSLLIRAFALRQLQIKDWWRVALREIPSGLALGAMLGLVGIVSIALWQYLGFYDYGEHWMLIALTVGATLIGIVMFGSLTGSMLPFALQRIGFDPGQRLGAVCCNPGRRHGIGDLFHRRFHDPAGNAAVEVSKPSDRANYKVNWLEIVVRGHSLGGRD
jgi:cation transporter-like permease